MRRTKRTTAVIAATAIIGALLTLVMAPPASAGFTCAGSASTAPDGKIKVTGGSFSGIGEYPATQKFDDSLDPGQETKFTMKWRNVSSTTRTIRLQNPAQNKPAGYSARYFLGPFNVTTALRDHGLRFQGIAPGGSTAALKLVVKNKSASGNPTLSSEVHGKYGGSASTICDQVIAFVNAPI